MNPDEVCCTDTACIGEGIWNRQIDFNKLQSLIQQLPNKEYITAFEVNEYNWVTIRYKENAVR